MLLYTFYLQSARNFSVFKKHVISEINLLVEDINIYEDNEHDLVIDCNAFYLSVTDKSESIGFIGEDYQLDLKYQLWFDLFYSEDGSSDKKMMKLIGNLINKNGEQCILLFNGDKPIMERKNGMAVVDGNSSTPFSCLNIEYVTGELEQV